MINELYNLHKSIDRAGIKLQDFHAKYNPIANISEKSPCVRIVISDGKVIKLSAVQNDLGKKLRKYGDNHSTYPCMNLKPLYRITDESIKKELNKIKPENIDSTKVEEIKSWCKENNWGSKFINKYNLCIKKSDELRKLTYEPIQILADESDCFREPEKLHKELETEVFRMLNDKENVSLALKILFYQSKASKEDDDGGKLSVALESEKLIEKNIPAVSEKFVLGLNKALLAEESEESGESIVDAFGNSFIPKKKSTKKKSTKKNSTMPEVKLSGGFTVKLRTMFKDQKCQYRYGKIGDESYPISYDMRKELQSSLSWIDGEDHKNVTWSKIDKYEILYAYSDYIPNFDESNISYVDLFKSDSSFEEQSKRFLTELKGYRKTNTESKADQMQIFILKKIDKARTKVIYTRQTDAYELEKCSEAWTCGCYNLPKFLFKNEYINYKRVPFPMDVADILNLFWNQSGDLATKNFKPIHRYHGLELFMESDLPVTTDLHMLVEKAMTVGVYLGNHIRKEKLKKEDLDKINRMLPMLPLVGLMLYRKGIRKEIYMKSFPYLYGQLIKVSDELHSLYCEVVRKGDLPNQLAGSSVYQAAVEAPLRTLNLLGQRMNPYITWAKNYRRKGNAEEGKKSWQAGWLLKLYENIAVELCAVWQPDTRFSDEEKAQLFIGYLAALPGTKQSEGAKENSKIEEED